MLSPDDRVYNTPEVSGLAAEMLQQHLLLERILRKCAYFKGCEMTTRNGIEPPLARKVSFSTYQTVNDYTNKLATEPVWPHRTTQAKKKKHKVGTRDHCSRAIVPPAPEDGSYKVRESLDGGKNGAVRLKEIGKDPLIENPPIFKPFFPLSSPLRLPVLQREKQEKTKLEKPSPRVQQLCESNIARHIDLVKEHKHNKLPALKVKEERRRMKECIKRQRERDFIAWEMDQSKFEATPFNRHTCISYKVENCQNPTSSVKDNIEMCQSKNSEQENIQRQKIKRQIKKSLEDRFAAFSCPILEMTFECDVK